jgi:hypothetical protein
MVQHIALTKARNSLGQLARRAYLHKERFILEKDGIPLAGLLGMDELEDYLELQDVQVRKQIADGYAEYRRGKSRSARVFLAKLQQTQRRKVA